MGAVSTLTLLLYNMLRFNIYHAVHRASVYMNNTKIYSGLIITAMFARPSLNKS